MLFTVPKCCTYLDMGRSQELIILPKEERFILCKFQLKHSVETGLQKIVCILKYDLVIHVLTTCHQFYYPVDIHKGKLKVIIIR